MSDGRGLEPTHTASHDVEAAAVQRQAGDLATYLRRVADALAAPRASTESVLAAALARDVRLGREQASFRPPEPRLVEGLVERAGPASAESGVEIASFECDTVGPRVRLAELAAAFGPWTPTPKPTTDLPIWPVRFSARYRRPGPAVAGAAEVVVLARLSADPVDSGAPVRQIVLMRQDPESSF